MLFRSAKLSEAAATPDDAQALLERDEKKIAPIAMRLFGDRAQCFVGPAGTSFCADGFGFHRAAVPASRPRLLLWCRFGNFFNETMYNMSIRSQDRQAARDVLRRIPDTPRHRYVFRYMVERLEQVARG